MHYKGEEKKVLFKQSFDGLKCHIQLKYRNAILSLVAIKHLVEKWKFTHVLLKAN